MFITNAYAADAGGMIDSLFRPIPIAIPKSIVACPTEPLIYSFDCNHIRLEAGFHPDMEGPSARHIAMAIHNLIKNVEKYEVD